MTGPSRVHIDLERHDAHPADMSGLQHTVEVAGDLLLSEVLTTVLVPFLAHTPRATWICRAVWSDQHRDVAEVVVSYGSPERLSSRLLVEDQPVSDFLGRRERAVGIYCRTRDRL